MPYPYGMQSAPAVGNGLGGLPRRQSDPKEPLIVEYLSKLNSVATSHSFKVPPGYSRMRVTLCGRGAPDTTSPNPYGGGKAISPVMQAVAGQFIEISFAASQQSPGNRVSIGAFVMTATDGLLNAGGTASGGETNLTGTDKGVGGITDAASTDMGSASGPSSTEGNNIYTGGSSPGAPGVSFLLGGNRQIHPGGRAMVRIVLW